MKPLMNNEWPEMPQDLLLRLEAAYPERSPEPSKDHSVEQMFFEAGKVDLIRFLRRLYNQQHS
jgi:hypothetical protein